VQAGTLCCPPSSLAGNDFEIVTLQRAHDDRLNYSALTNRIGQLTEFFVRKHAARIPGIGTQIFDRRATRFTSAICTGCFLADVSNQRSETASQSRVIRHCRCSRTRH
jgi:hypothetical protein